MSNKIRFKINNIDHMIDGKYGPDVSLNEYIRTVADLRGTKAMCHEGGCGACVVTVRAPHPVTQEVKTFAVNSCLVSVLSCHGWEVVTVEGIGNRTLGYHPIQTRLANFNGTQCGYCTPGWVMNMYSLYESKNHKLSAEDIENSFAGNICRCTGYRPIADAFKSFAIDADKDLVSKVCDMEDFGFFKHCGTKCNGKCPHKKKQTKNAILGKYATPQNDDVNDQPGDWCVLAQDDKAMIEVNCDTHVWFKVFNLSQLFEAMSKGPDYKLIAGNTGQGVYHVKDYPKNVIDIFSVAELKGYLVDVNLVLGAGMPLSEMMEVFIKMSNENEDFTYLKRFHEHMDLVAHIPVRNIGTIAGNLMLKHAHQEFQSDVFLLFETVGAMLTISEGINKSMTVSMLDFLNIDMKGKIIVNAMLPPLSKSLCLFKCYKIMPRSQNAHAAVNAGFLFQLSAHNNNIIEKASIVYGSISPSFNHAVNTEKVLVGKDLFSNDTLQLALSILKEEIHPEEALPEPPVKYRKKLALCLFYKAVLSLAPDNKINPKFRSGAEAIKRSTSKGTQTFDTDKSLWPLNQPVPKLEALVQCSGEATFANDMPTQTDEVFGSFVLACVPPGSVIDSFDASEALKLPGIIAFYSAKDIPGKNTFTPTNVPLQVEDEEIICSKIVKYYGQPAGIIVAKREKLANKAATLVKINYSSIGKSKPLTSIEDVMASPEKSTRTTVNKTVEPSELGHDVKTVVYGEYKIEAQYHYTMETQTCVVKPTEDGMEVYSSTQWLDLCNLAVATCLNKPANSINVIVRRLGGAYGCKISRASQTSCAAAIVSYLQGKTCRFILPLETNMKSVGKRAETSSTFEVGLNKEGEIQYLKNTFYQDNGCSNNETISPLTMLHFANCYDTRRWYMQAGSVLTDKPSTTWCRAPSSTEGIAMIEYMMERIAHDMQLDPIEVRIKNMRKENNPLPNMIEQIKRDSDYDNRLIEISNFNQNNRWRKRALKMIVMSYDLEYFGNFNSLVSIYHGDGTVVITHGGIEMGQGINTKVAQVAAYILGVPLEKVSVKPSSSFTSPNSMVTGGSIGSECVSYATVKACEIILKRLEPIKEKMGNPAWKDLVVQAYFAGVDLQASYMYSSNDGLKAYNIYGVTALELELDVLSGNHEVKRVDLLEDIGRSLSPQIDIGQIEGAFIMGLGYWTSEKLLYDSKTGELLTDRTWTYKPPGIKDIPADMRIYFSRNSTNENGVLQSKATGEPAFCMSVVVTHALREAVRASRLDAGHQNSWVEIKNPCTLENIFEAIEHKIEDFKLI